jgi:protein-tyrosine-phosphatase
MPDPTIPSTLFICYGNVARSQMAQGWYNYYTHSQRGSSAGTSTISHLFHQPTDEASTVMIEEGINISQQSVTQLTPQLAQQADRLVILCKPSDCPNYIHQHPQAVFNEIEDPFGKNTDFYRSVREQIRLLVQTLLP